MRALAGTLLRAGLSLLLGLALVSCTDDPKPGTLGTPTPTPTSSSASPSPTTPEAQIEAAVRAYYAELTRAVRSGDSRQLKPMVTGGCPCARPIRVVDRNERLGYSVPDASFELVSVRVHDVQGETALAEVKTSEAAYTVFDRDSKVVGKVGAKEQLLDLSLVQQPSGAWVIANLFDLLGDP